MAINYPTASQFAFTKTGTGDNQKVAMTKVQDIPLDQVDNDLTDVANSVSDYKDSNGGDSKLQTTADNLNNGIAGVTSVVTAVATSGLSLKYQIAAGAVSGYAASKVVSPEGLSITHKFDKTK